MYLVSNVMSYVNSNIIDYVYDMFFLNKADRYYNYFPEDRAKTNKDFSDLVDIMNQVCELSIYEDIADMTGEALVW